MTTPNYTPVYYNIQAIVTRTITDSAVTYDCACYPPKLTVTTSNAIIGYQLIDPTPGDIVFTGMTKINPPPVRQLSDPAMSVDGRTLLISDRNSVAADIHIKLHFRDGDGLEFSHDPQIGNVPES
jgi:hypothetical protein